MRSAELFAGLGGLAYGTSEAGFKHTLVLEIDQNACNTIALNAAKGTRHYRHWPVLGADVRSIDFKKMGRDLDLLSGGPPCQPFSMDGQHKGPTDERNMWPEAIRALKELRPKAFLFENVRGLLRPAFGDYLEFLELCLAYPSRYDPQRAWKAQLKTMRGFRAKGLNPSYRVIVQAVNAADYGAAQKRHRAIIWGIRSDIASSVEPLKPTHSRNALIWSQRVDGDYWVRHKIPAGLRSELTTADARILQRLLADGKKPIEKPWVTVRDSVGDLPRPVEHFESVRNHRLHPGARTYAGHTGSLMDEPAKALKAGCHGVPGGENALVQESGEVRYFTVREMIRLQGLPDNFFLDATWASATKQLGNAVPVQMAQAFARHIRGYLAQSPRR